ncbi:hypothetical protein [Solibacillus sp. NPDC093137]|uniref:hypothetical protein n=1 Tax=Solibacillus sp. NPDC093137 TaxID=3390678 RepID=UPI003D05DBB8
MSNQLIIKQEIENLQNKIEVITKTVKEFSSLSESELEQINPIANVLLNIRISNRELLEVYTNELKKEQEKYCWLVSQSKSMTN